MEPCQYTLYPVRTASSQLCPIVSPALLFVTLSIQSSQLDTADMEDELISMALIKVSLEPRRYSLSHTFTHCPKHGRKLVVGTTSGVLAIFSWGHWGLPRLLTHLSVYLFISGDMSDRFPGHPNSVDTMIVVDEETIITGSSDGLIRCVFFFFILYFRVFTFPPSFLHHCLFYTPKPLYLRY